MNILLNCRLFLYFFFLCKLPSLLVAAPLVSDDKIKAAIERSRQDGSFYGVDTIRNLIEIRCRNAPTETKIDGLESLIRLGASVLETRDISIDLSEPVGMWPNFDARAFGAKFPIFSGTDPASIKDSKIREAYEKAVEVNRKKMVKFGSEEMKMDTARSALDGARALLLEVGTREAFDRAREVIRDASGHEWVKKFIGGFFPEVANTSLQVMSKISKNDKSYLKIDSREVDRVKTSSAHTRSMVADGVVFNGKFGIVASAIALVVGLLWLYFKAKNR